MTPPTLRNLSFYLIISCTTLGACGRDEFSDGEDLDANSMSWYLLEGEEEEEISIEDSPLLGDWSGPGNYGGCIAEGSWQSYRGDGSFTQVNFDQNACAPQEERAMVPCKGAWRLMNLHGETGRAGAMLYACRRSAMWRPRSSCSNVARGGRS